MVLERKKPTTFPGMHLLCESCTGAREQQVEGHMLMYRHAFTVRVLYRSQRKNVGGCILMYRHAFTECLAQEPGKSRSGAVYECTDMHSL